MITLPIWTFVLIIAGTIMVSIAFTLFCVFLFGMWQMRKEFYKDEKQRETDLKNNSHFKESSE